MTRQCNDVQPTVDDNEFFYHSGDRECAFRSPEDARIAFTGVKTAYVPPKKRAQLAKEDNRKRFESLFTLFQYIEYIGSYAQPEDNDREHKESTDPLEENRRRLEAMLV